MQLCWFVAELAYVVILHQSESTCHCQRNVRDAKTCGCTHMHVQTSRFAEVACHTVGREDTIQSG